MHTISVKDSVMVSAAVKSDCIRLIPLKYYGHALQTTKINISGQLWVHDIKFSSFEVDSLSAGVLEQHYEGRPILMHSIELHPINSSLLPYLLILLLISFFFSISCLTDSPMSVSITISVSISAAVQFTASHA